MLEEFLSLKPKPATYKSLQPKKMSDIYKGIFPEVIPTPGGGTEAVPFTNVTRELPNAGGSYQAPVIQQPSKPAGQTPPPQPQTPAGVDYSKYTDPLTGKVMSPAEYADFVAKRAMGGSVPAYAGDSLVRGPQTTEQLTSTATDLNNQRNDIAVGESDPYKVASKSGIAYSPAEMTAIEKAYAGIYDPAIKDVFAKLERKTKEEEEAAQLKRDLEKMAKQHQYDVELKSIGGGPGSNNQMTDNERAAQTLFQSNPIVKDYNTVVNQKNTIDRIITNGVGGPADVSAIFTFMKALDPNSVVRESEYDKAAASGNLFQGIWTRFNGYFKDKGGILPDNVRQEFQNLINQKLAAQGVSYKNLAQKTREIAQRQGMNPDNVVIDFTEGVLNPVAEVLRSPDGTQEVNVADLTPEELAEAKSLGWK